MIYFIKLLTMEYPRYEGDIRLEHPEILESQTGDAFPCPDTYAPVEFVNPPSSTETQSVEIGVPAQDEAGKWKMTWIIRDLTPEEIQAIKDYKEQMQKEMQAKTETDSDNPQ